MQLTRVVVTNFRVIKEFDHSWTREPDQRPRPLTLILGANSSGKTTVLQAIALTLSLASRQTTDVASFRWPGFLAENMSSRGPTRIELDVLFHPQELDEVRRVHQLWVRRARPELARVIPPPGQMEQVTLRFEDGAVGSPQGPEAVSQFLGRYFTKYLVKAAPELRDVFNSVGDVFWFPQNRSHETLEDLREYLVRWWGYFTSGQGEASAYLHRLETYLQRLFPGTRFVGLREPAGEPRTGPLVMLERNGLRYDISEMSSGEQAVFGIFYEFARLNIARSIVLIDELELHLHPPQQQTLIAALRELGPDCQFIVTSHSPYLEEVTPDDDEIRLEGGLRCL